MNDEEFQEGLDEVIDHTKLLVASQILSTLVVHRESTGNYSRERTVDIALEYTNILFRKVIKK